MTQVFEVNGKKIKIVSYPHTYLGFQLGWNVTINGSHYTYFRVTEQEARDEAYVAWVKRYQ